MNILASLEQPGVKEFLFILTSMLVLIGIYTYVEYMKYKNDKDNE